MASSKGFLLLTTFMPGTLPIFRTTAIR
uniref:Uncharacterized protein n=1 Tax=Arundo donax TaxID=35708 RepID=A0A0A9AZK4_ARUDO